MKEIGEMLVDLHGQHAHQSLVTADGQRSLVDAFGGFTTLALATAAAWREWRAAIEQRDRAAAAQEASAAERETLASRQRELSSLSVTADEWNSLTQAQSRLAHAAALLEAAASGEEELTEADSALTRRLASLLARLEAGAVHDPALKDVLALLEPARIQLVEAARELRAYRPKLDLDPAELARVEERQAAIHDVARKYRVRPEELPELLAQTEAQLSALAEASDSEALAKRAAATESSWRRLANELTKKRRFAAHELESRVANAMQQLAMKGGRFEIGLVPLATPTSHGSEQAEFRVASHPKQPLGPLARVASGGELSRIALAIQVVTSEVGEVPTLIFDEVDAASARRRRQPSAGSSIARQSPAGAVRHASAQVAAFADAHFRVTKHGDEATVRAEVEHRQRPRIEELARMLAGSAITAKTRARKGAAPAAPPSSARLRHTGMNFSATPLLQ